jgi:hypothetical protein
MSFKAISGASALIATFAAGYLALNGYVLIIDRTGLVSNVSLFNSVYTQELMQVTPHIWVGVPRLEGSIRLNCKTEQTFEVGYVGSGIQETLVIEDPNICNATDK